MEKEKFPFRVTLNLYKDADGPIDVKQFTAQGDYKTNCKRMLENRLERKREKLCCTFKTVDGNRALH